MSNIQICLINLNLTHNDNYIFNSISNAEENYRNIKINLTLRLFINTFDEKWLDILNGNSDLISNIKNYSAKLIKNYTYWF